MTEKQVFLKMLDRIGAGYGTRDDVDPPGTSVQVEHPVEDSETEFYVSEWTFNDNGELVNLHHYKGEPG